MKACRVVLISRGLRIWIPPEVYLVGDLAEREASRWREALRLPRQPGTFSQNARALHLVESLFPEQWRACPVWVGVTWSSRSFPRLKIELMAADEDEATEWLRGRVPKKVELERPGHVEFELRGGLTSAGIYRIKRVMGF
jgi:hypothetical protein